jgi:hypothetical protein
MNHSAGAAKPRNISGLRRFVTTIYSLSRRFTSGYQEVIRSGFLFLFSSHNFKPTEFGRFKMESGSNGLYL